MITVKTALLATASVILVLWPERGMSQSDSRIGWYVRDAAPHTPAFPLTTNDCAAYAAALQRFQAEASAKHQECLDSVRGDCPDDELTGCSCLRCGPLHGSVSMDGVGRCYREVSQADDRIGRVNQALTVVGASAGELLTRQGIGNFLRNATAGSELAQDLGRISAIAHGANNIQKSLLALQTDTAKELSTSPAHVGDILQELARRGFSRNPVALLLTVIALGYVAQTHADALGQLTAQLAELTRQLSAPVPLNPPSITPGTPPSNGRLDCSLLQNAQTNRDLMTRDASAWLALVQQCNPK